MYRQFGGSALLLLLATSAITYVSGTAGRGSSYHAATKQTNQQAEQTVAGADAHKCYVFQLLRRYNGFIEQGPQAAQSSTAQNPSADALACAQPSLPEGTPAGMDTVHSQVILATVPDPLQSSEDLEFDRDIEALLEAASTAGYDFELMVSPWRVTDLDQPKGLKEARDTDFYRRIYGDEPGAMLFRRRAEGQQTSKEDLLLMILVPESPTYGLNLHAAREAMSALPALRAAGFHTSVKDKDESTVRWIGPNYSASAPELKRFKDIEYPSIPFDVLSGSITTDGANKLLSAINGGSQHLVSLSEPDGEAIRTLLASRILGEEGTVAVLQEDETAYGGEHFSAGGGNADQPIRYFSFPRGISHVRGVYGNSLKTFHVTQTQDNESKSSDSDSSLNFQDELQQPLDSVPEFASQSPSSNESVLSAIAASIKHIHTHALVILTSDPLDQLFLARYFRQQCPDTQIVLFNAERLLTHLHGDFNLDGTLVLTRFPLFQNSYLQTPFTGQPRHAVTFANSREESIFLAALMQIKSWRDAPVQAPFSGKQYGLAPWIGVAAGGDFWPVAYLGEGRKISHKINLNQSLLLTDTPPEQLPVLWTLVLFALLLLATMHFVFYILAVPFRKRFHKSGSQGIQRAVNHRVLTFYLIANEDAPESITTGQCWWLWNVTIQFVLLLCYFLLPAALYEARILGISSIGAGLLSFTWQMTMFLCATLFVLCLQVALLVMLFLFLLRRLLENVTNRRNWVECLMLPAVSLLWMMVVLRFFCGQLVDRPTSFSFADRCLHLSSGACPILPLLLLSCGFLLAAVVNLNALGLAVNRNPGLPAIFQNTVDMNCWQDKVTKYIECWYGLPGLDNYLLTLTILLGCLLLHPRHLFSTFDVSSVSWLYTFSFVMAIWTILWLWVRFMRVWGALRFGLDFLEGSPLRFAFSRLPNIFSVDPIWSYAGLRRFIVLPMRWQEYLRVAPLADKTAEMAASSQALKDILHQMGNAQWVSGIAYNDFSQSLNDYALKLAGLDAIETSWRRGGPDCALIEKKDASQKEENKCPQSRSDIPSPCGTVFDKDDCCVEIGNEFIAVRIAAYIRYITLHMKNLMTFMSLGFLFTLLAAISYPFNRPQVIAWSATLLLAALLFSVATVLAQMDRDAILSRLSNSSPGKLDYVTLLKNMATVGGLPLITLLSTLFPVIGKFLFSWAGPVFENLH
jgi:hypothetical protein